MIKVYEIVGYDERFKGKKVIVASLPDSGIVLVKYLGSANKGQFPIENLKFKCYIDKE